MTLSEKEVKRLKKTIRRMKRKQPGPALQLTVQRYILRKKNGDARIRTVASFTGRICQK